MLPVRFELKDGRACAFRKMVEDDAEELCCLLPLTHAESDFLNYRPGEFDMNVEVHEAEAEARHADLDRFRLEIDAVRRTRVAPVPAADEVSD